MVKKQLTSTLIIQKAHTTIKVTTVTILAKPSQNKSVTYLLYSCLLCKQGELTDERHNIYFSINNTHIFLQTSMLKEEIKSIFFSTNHNN